MRSAKLAASLLLLALLVGGAGALAWWGARMEEGAPGVHEVIVEGPDGLLHAGPVHVADPTALGALLAAAEAAGLEVDREDYAGMGTYVRAVGGHRAHGATGWIYDVRRDGEWIHGDRSAELFALREGDAVRWRWTSL